MLRVVWSVLRELYDIILLDDLMPKMRGKETLDELNKIPGFNLPVVALTANAITGMREKYLNEFLETIERKETINEEIGEYMNLVKELLFGYEDWFENKKGRNRESKR